MSATEVRLCPVGVLVGCLRPPYEALSAAAYFLAAGAAALAFDTGAKLLTAFVRYTGTGIAIQFSTPLNVNRSMDRSTEIRRVTQVIADEFESSIAANPESWHMLQRIFVDKDFRSR